VISVAKIQCIGSGAGGFSAISHGIQFRAFSTPAFTALHGFSGRVPHFHLDILYVCLKGSPGVAPGPRKRADIRSNHTIRSKSHGQEDHKETGKAHENN